MRLMSLPEGPSRAFPSVSLIMFYPRFFYSLAYHFANSFIVGCSRLPSPCRTIVLRPLKWSLTWLTVETSASFLLVLVLIFPKNSLSNVTMLLFDFPLMIDLYWFVSFFSFLELLIQSCSQTLFVSLAYLPKALKQMKPTKSNLGIGLPFESSGYWKGEGKEELLETNWNKLRLNKGLPFRMYWDIPRNWCHRWLPTKKTYSKKDSQNWLKQKRPPAASFCHKPNKL